MLVPPSLRGQRTFADAEDRGCRFVHAPHARSKSGEKNARDARLAIGDFGEGNRTRDDIESASHVLDLRGCLAARRALRNPRKPRKVTRHARTGDDAAVFVDERDCEHGAPIVDGLDQVLKCFFADEAALGASFHDARDRSEMCDAGPNSRRRLDLGAQVVVVPSFARTMDARRRIHCPTCTVEFTLDVPRTWVRCPSCGHGFVVKRVSRDTEEAAPPQSERAVVDTAAVIRQKTGWVVTGPDGAEHRFDSIGDLGAAIARGDLDDPEPESAPMDVSLSEIEVAPRAGSSSNDEIAPGVALVPLEALDRLERRSEAPPSGERDRSGRGSTPPVTLYERAEAEAPASVPASTEPLVAESASPSPQGTAPDAEGTELADNADIEDDGADLEPSFPDETPLLPSTRMRLSETPSTVKKSVATKKSVAAKTADRKTSTPVARSVKPETPARSWTLPVLGVAAVGAIVWALTRPRTQSEPAAGTPTAAATSVASTSTSPEINPVGPPVVIRSEAEAAVMTIPPTTAVSARLTGPIDTARAAASASSAIRAMTPGGDGGGADAVAQRAQASAAFRAGDLPKARLLYEQLVARNAHDVEAWSALGDTARAQGSMADAESAHRRALGINPRYLPSLLGLADIGWDNGDRAGAQKRYAELLERFPLEMLPERVKTRAQ